MGGGGDEGGIDGGVSEEKTGAFGAGSGHGADGNPSTHERGRRQSDHPKKFPPPEKPVANSDSTQTERQPTVEFSASMQTPTTPTRTYAAGRRPSDTTDAEAKTSGGITEASKEQGGGKGRRAQQGAARKPPAPPQIPMGSPGTARPPPATPATKESPLTT